MRLALRLARALLVFGVIFASYMFQLGLARAFRRSRIDDGHEVYESPAWLVRRADEVDRVNAQRLRRGMVELRGVYIKLGQVLSIMGGFLPEVYGKELETLQDRVPPRAFDEIARAFEESLGRRPEACFRDISETPLAAASLGQVHEAHLEGGTRVAVKILYPGIRDVVRTDLRVVRLALDVYKRFVPVQNLDSAYDALVDLLRRETDYVHEAACMERMARNFAGSTDLVFPSVFRDLSSREVLTMTYMEGIKITKFDELEALGVSRRKLATQFTRAFYKQLFVDRFFHADPHPGNFLVQVDPATAAARIVVLDFGAACEVGQPMVDGMVDLLQGLFEQRDDLVVRGFHRIGFVAEEGNTELVERTVKTYFQKLLKVQDRSAGALMRATREQLEDLVDPEVERRELRELMRSVRYPEGWFYVERAAILAFWLIGQIDPTLDTLKVGFPYLLPLLAERTQAPPAAS